MVGAGNESCIEKILIKLKMNRVFMETGESVHERIIETS